jgi:hypothetical protein
MPKKKTTQKPTEEPEKEDQEYKSPVQILDGINATVEGLTEALTLMAKHNAEAQNRMVANMQQMSEHVNRQTTVMNDFALQVQRLTRNQNTFGDLGSVMLEMQSHLVEEKEVMRTNKRELRAQTKEAIHFLDKLRNLLIDFQHYWREE